MIAPVLVPQMRSNVSETGRPVFLSISSRTPIE